MQQQPLLPGVAGIIMIFCDSGGRGLAAATRCNDSSYDVLKAMVCEFDTSVRVMSADRSIRVIQLTDLSESEPESGNSFPQIDGVSEAPPSRATVQAHSSQDLVHHLLG